MQKNQGPHFYRPANNGRGYFIDSNIYAKRLIMNENRVSETGTGWMMHGHPGHTIWIPKDGRWSFNGDLANPTFSPSINEMDYGHHFFVKDGIVQYLADGKVPCCEGQSEFYPLPVWKTG